MNFPDGLGDQAIKDIVRDHPHIGAILEKHEIGCVTCTVGICLLKDVVSIHGLPAEEEVEVEREIREYLEQPRQAAAQEADRTTP
ncbi:MAG: hypothetical protein P1P84_17155 [Deferrisomatales bacterium]|nr:hypothetical protein [Deferrisomatales bacterium]